MDDKLDLQLPSIFEKRMLPKGSVFCRYGTRKNRLSSTTHILGGATMGENSTEGVVDKNNKIFRYKNLYIIDSSMISANLE
jgi:choline dehydrogenase-like flavoprotein